MVPLYNGSISSSSTSYPDPVTKESREPPQVLPPPYTVIWCDLTQYPLLRGRLRKGWEVYWRFSFAVKRRSDRNCNEIENDYYEGLWRTKFFFLSGVIGRSQTTVIKRKYECTRVYVCVCTCMYKEDKTTQNDRKARVKTRFQGENVSKNILLTLSYFF